MSSKVWVVKDGFLYMQDAWPDSFGLDFDWSSRRDRAIQFDSKRGAFQLAKAHGVAKVYRAKWAEK